jgi:hypothetical protein
MRMPPMIRILLILLLCFAGGISAETDTLDFSDFPDIYDTDISFWDEFIPGESKTWFRLRKKSGQPDYFDQYFRIELPERLLLIHNDMVYAEKPMKSWNSAKLQLGSWHFYYGRGSIKLGQGYYFGDEFGKLSVSNSQNMTTPQIKFAMKPYSGYSEIKAVAYENDAVQLAVFEGKDGGGGAFSLQKKGWSGGGGMYLLEKPLMELWGAYQPHKSFRVSGSSSFSQESWGHFSGELISAPEKIFRLYLLGMATSGAFFSSEGDIRWSGRPKPGSRGIGAGIRWQIFTGVNYEFFQYRLHKPEERLDEQFHQLGWKRGGSGFQFRYRYSNHSAVGTVSEFPYLIQQSDEALQLFQTRLMLQLDEKMSVSSGGDFFLQAKSPTALWLRGLYKTNRQHFRLQWSRGFSDREHPLYLLRINGGGTYRIQSIRQEAQWLDGEWRIFYENLAFSLLAAHSQKETEFQMQLQIALND